MFPNPVIFDWQLQWYTLWQFIAIITTLSFAFSYIKYANAVKIPLTKYLLLVGTLIVLGYFGAKAFAFLDYFTETGKGITGDLLGDFSITQGGLRWYGSLLILLISAPLIGKLLKIDNWINCLDFIALKLCLFTVIVKQACLFSGDGCYGIYTNLPWGMYFPYGAAPNILPVHPTPLYDSLFHLILFFLLFKLNKRKAFDGQITIVYFFATSIFNIALDTIRRNPDIFFTLSLSQITYFIIILITIVYQLNLKKNVPSG